MKEFDEEDIYKEDLDGRVSRVDKWKYNDTLNILARNALFSKGLPQFSNWVDRFVAALKPINTKRLPLKKKLEDADDYFYKIEYFDKREKLKLSPEIWGDPYKKGGYLDKWSQNYWEALFDYSLELATQAGFTIYLVKHEHRIGGGGVGFDDQIPTSEE